MYLSLSLLAAVVITLLAVSKIAKMLLAKRPGLEWITAASLVSAAIAIVTYLGLNVFVKGLDPYVMLGITFTAMLLISSAAFKFINKMSWSGAIATNVANIVIVLATSVAAVVLNGESLSETVSTITSSAKSNTQMVDSMVTGQSPHIEPAKMSIPEDELVEDSDIEPMITELNLLPPGTIKAIEKEKKRKYIAPKYHVVSISSIGSLVGKTLKIHKDNGSVIKGYLQNINGNDAIINRRMSSGTAIVPVSLASIKKLEVYK